MRSQASRAGLGTDGQDRTAVSPPLEPDTWLARADRWTAPEGV
jgi:hypothetical protein